MEKYNHSESFFEVLQKLETRIAVLERQLTTQKEEIQNLKAKLVATEAAASSETITVEDVTGIKPTTRRTVLRRLAAGLVAGAAFAVLPSSAPTAQARSIISPKSYSNDIGAIIVSKATQISGQPTDITANFGLIATGDSQLDMSKLPTYDTGVYAKGGGYGVYATTDRGAAPAVYAINTAGSGFANNYAIQAVSLNGTAIYGEGALHGAGLSALAKGDGPGIQVQAMNGGPVLRLVPSAAPAGGTAGDVYTDTSGNLYVYATLSGGSGQGWRKVAFAT